MKNTVKINSWLRYIAAGVFGAMLVFNVMVSLDFENDNMLPSLTLSELGNVAMAQSENCGGTCTPNDCPWYNPFCDDYSGADPQTYFERIGNCTKMRTDCYPGTGSCSESTYITCM